MQILRDLFTLKKSIYDLDYDINIVHYRRTVGVINTVVVHVYKLNKKQEQY